MLKANSFQGGLESGSKEKGVCRGSKAIRVSDDRQPSTAASAENFPPVVCPIQRANLRRTGPAQCTTSGLSDCKRKANGSVEATTNQLLARRLHPTGEVGAQSSHRGAKYFQLLGRISAGIGQARGLDLIGSTCSERLPSRARTAKLPGFNNGRSSGPRFPGWRCAYPPPAVTPSRSFHNRSRSDRSR